MCRCLKAFLVIRAGIRTVDLSCSERSELRKMLDRSVHESKW